MGDLSAGAFLAVVGRLGVQPGDRGQPAVRGGDDPPHAPRRPAEPARGRVDPQVVANHFVTTVDGPARTYPLVASPAQFDGTPPSLARAPEHGEHTEEILLELGLDWDQILAHKEAGAVL
jgi:hypothetical protein